jgi:hypothetical protein
MSDERSIVGDLINFRGLVYAPVNENGVIFLFGKVAKDLHMYVEEVKPGFPDCIARRFTGKGWERCRVEFEFYASNFKDHKHEVEGCDLIVCWEDDWKDCPIEVVELKSVILELENEPISRPGESTADAPEVDAAFDEQGAGDAPRRWWAEIFKALEAYDDEIWLNVGRKAKKFIGLYAPERSFASLGPKKNSLGFECFTRGEPIPGVTVSSEKYSPRWGRFTVKSDEQVAFAVETLKTAHKRLKEALKAGEQTSYYSGGIGFKKGTEEADDVDGDAKDQR